MTQDYQVYSIICDCAAIIHHCTGEEYGDASKVGSTREGVVQLEFNVRRGHICNTGWDDVDAQVVYVEFNLDDARTDYDPYPEGK